MVQQNNKAKKNISDMTKIGIGASVAAVVAVGALGAYMLYGPENKKRRQHVKSWMLKMKAEVLEKLEKAKEVNEDSYKTIVDGIAKKYQELKDVDPVELAGVIAELADSFREMKKEGSGGKKKAKVVSKK
ncbi:MAG: hypothetical protein WC757_00890 [Candidatus Paceibacterota bacterium]|jgi:hypothetical protein